ncbi:MAG: hypothetical protein AAF266_05740 [Planctomycetota bacterium]
MAGDTGNTTSTIFGACAAFGVLLLAAGIVMPSLGRAPSEGEKRDAAEFIEASRAMEAAAAAPTREERAAAMAAAREKYSETKDRVEAARAAPGVMAFWMKAIGGLVAIVGIGGFYATRPQ